MPLDDLLKSITPPDGLAEFQEADILYQAIKAAAKYNLETEFISYFLRFIREGKSTIQAIIEAKDEWDID